MPNASARIETEEHLDLKTLPGGWVKLRRMTYGQSLHRQQIAMQIAVSGESGGRQRQAKGSVSAGEIKMMQKAVAVFEFANCVVDHNLFMHDEESVKYDFTRGNALDSLDPRVGAEISARIAEMNDFEEDGEGNSITVS